MQEPTEALMTIDKPFIVIALPLVSIVLQSEYYCSSTQSDIVLYQICEPLVPCEMPLPAFAPRNVSKVKWRLMVASCFRRMGNYQKALELYEHIHVQYPENLECKHRSNSFCGSLKNKSRHMNTKLFSGGILALRENL